ncbi:hypothetical protein [Kitasatospora sp. NPDC057015]|uniref:hypothetical protein n=1 Tax=Kitasatospora sp. NPDC057015 TaxID=3346001 RepID=UPI003637B9CC
MIKVGKTVRRVAIGVAAGLALTLAPAMTTPASAAVTFRYLANQQYGDYLTGSLNGTVTTETYTGLGAQWWDFMNKGGGYYTLYNAHEPSKLLAEWLETWAVATRTANPTWAAHTEQWWVAYGPNGTIYIHNRGNNNCLTAKGRGNAVRAEPCRTGDRSQLWYQTSWTG